MPTHSRRALARLAFSAAAAQLADRVRAQVPTEDDNWLKPGELVDHARSLLVAAEELLEKAVVLERERGTSWAELGEVLDISKQAAQQRHGQAVEDWTEGVNQALVVIGTRFTFARVPGEGGEDPGELAERLDAWCLQYIGKYNKPRSAKPVSSSLELAGPAEQVVLLNRLAQRMLRERDPAKLRAFQAAKTAFLSSLADETPEDVEAQRAAARSLRELAALKPPAIAKDEKRGRVLSIADARKKPRKPRS